MKLKPILTGSAAALSIVTPAVAATPDFNLSAVGQYSDSQVTSVSQFSDVKNTDWAYQALSNLVERYGCVAGYPDGTFKGGQSMTRYEAAALLNSCLDRVTEVTDELKRLMQEFQSELAVIRGRLTKVEANVAALEATQFSTTTKLTGQATFVLGGVNSSGNSLSRVFDIPGSPDFNKNNAAAKYNARYGGVNLSYDVRLNLNTSFTGKDLLYTRLRSGNFNNAFNGQGVNLTFLDVASNGFGSGPGYNSSNVVGIDRLFYKFPVNDEVSLTIGAIARNTEMLGMVPSAYARQSSQKILDFFAVHGAPGTYNKATGTAFGATWKQKVKPGQGAFNASINYVAPQGNFGQVYDGNPYDCSVNEGGLLTNCSRSSLLTQVGYVAPQWGVAAAYRYGQAGSNFRRGTNYAASNSWWLANGSSSSFALNAYWQPKQSGWAPSVSAGWGINNLSGNQTSALGNTYDVFPVESQSWFVGLQWDDVLQKGNSLGVAVGQPTFVTSQNKGTFNFQNTTPYDGNYAIEAWYSYKVSDNISVTPSVFWLSAPLGQDAITVNNGVTNYGSFGVFGALVQTTFKF